jgi:kynurenine formamidase
MCVPGTIETVRERSQAEGPRLSRRSALAAGAAALAAGALPGTALAGGGRGHRHHHSRRRLVDLTWTYSDTFPQFPGTPRTERRTHVTIPANGFYGQVWTLWEHTGTHMDVPGHFIEGGRKSPDMTLDELIAPLVVIDISRRAAQDPDTVVEPDDLFRFERKHGRIPKGAVVAMNSGWEARAGSEAAYRNADASGVMHFPGFGTEATAWLWRRRGIGGIGVDTLSLDPGNATVFDTHLEILGADRYGIENLRNLSQVPASGATVTLGLIPWFEGSGGPCRAFATY